MKPLLNMAFSFLVLGLATCYPGSIKSKRPSGVPARPPIGQRYPGQSYPSQNPNYPGQNDQGQYGQPYGYQNPEPIKPARPPIGQRYPGQGYPSQNPNYSGQNDQGQSYPEQNYQGQYNPSQNYQGQNYPYQGQYRQPYGYQNPEPTKPSGLKVAGHVWEHVSDLVGGILAGPSHSY